MDILPLREFAFEEIIDAFSKAFADYVVKMPTELHYWEKRLFGARLDYDHSFAAVENNEIVGFIWLCIDTYRGKKTAYNTGTGVLPTWRGHKIVDQLYQHAFPLLRASGVEHCNLEVIQSNQRAVRVYERIGFSVQKDYSCVKSELTAFSLPVNIQKVAFDEIPKIFMVEEHWYSWDNTKEAISVLGGHYESYLVLNKKENPIGYFTISPSNGYLAQCFIQLKDFKTLFSGIAQKLPVVQINNIDKERKELISFIEQNSFNTVIKQFEMCLEL